MISLLVPLAALGLALPDSLSAGRVAVITGAASGLGKAAALKCAGMGMRVCLADIDQSDLEATAVECSAVAAQGAEDVLSMVVDVSSLSDVQEFKAKVYERFGETAFLLNNAGTGIGSPSALQDLSGWRNNLEVNLFGALHVLQTFVPSMLEQRGSSHERCTIVNTGSKQGLTCPPGNVRKPDSNPRPFALLELEFLCPSSLQSAEGRTFESHSGRLDADGRLCHTSHEGRRHTRARIPKGLLQACHQ